MEKEKFEFEKLTELLSLPVAFNTEQLHKYIQYYIEKNADDSDAILELDRSLALLQNHLVTFSLLIKQKYLLALNNTVSNQEPDQYYTKQELAIKYRVSLRTVTNWIIDGLEVEEIGGIKRISKKALQNFVKTKNGKKFNWKSIANKITLEA